MVRKMLSVIIGYAIFVATSLALFKFSGHAPHTEASTTFMLLTAIYGVVSSFISGWVVPFIAKTKDLRLNYILAFILAGFATFSYFKAEGSHWTQILAVFIFAPTSILGGWYFVERRS